MSDEFFDKLRDYVTDAIRFWETGRFVYNTVLLVITVLVYVFVPSDMKTSLHPSLFVPLFLLAVVANLLYCLAYPVDLFVQLSRFRDAWRRYRWLLLLMGTLIASVLALLSSLNLFSVSPAF